MPDRGRVRLDVFSVDGRRLASLVDRRLDAGRHQAVWDGRDQAGNAAAAGTYFVTMRHADRTVTRRLTLVR